MENEKINDLFSKIKVDDEKVDELIREKDEVQQESERKKRELHYRNYANVPARYFDESLATYKASKENLTTFRWICGFVDAVKKGQNKKNLLYLSGNYGTGKTHIGCGIIRELGGYIITSLELCISYDSCRDFKSEITRFMFLQQLCNNDVLIIDEVGKGIKSIENEILPYIIDKFYGSGKLLIFIGNSDKKEFLDLVGGASADRFNEVGACFSLIGASNRVSEETKRIDEAIKRC